MKHHLIHCALADCLDFSISGLLFLPPKHSGFVAFTKVSLTFALYLTFLLHSMMSLFNYHDGLRNNHVEAARH